MIVRVSVIAPFVLDLTARILQRVPFNTVDRWDGKAYRRAVALGRRAFVLHVTEAGTTARPAVIITGDFPESHADEVRAMGARLLGLRVNLNDFYARIGADTPLAWLAHALRGMKPPRFPSIFEALVNAVCCQQVSLFAGLRVMNRIADLAGRAVQSDGDVFHIFPSPAQTAAFEPAVYRAAGLSNAKAASLIEIARAFAGGDVREEDLERLPSEAAIEKLRRLRGVGPWTARYALLRGLGRLDVFPAGDSGAALSLRRLLGLDSLTLAEATQFASSWRDYQGFLYFHLLGSRFLERPPGARSAIESR